MITNEKVDAGTVVVCDRSRFGGNSTDIDKKNLAVVITPSARQFDRVVEAVPLTDKLPIDREVKFVALRHESLRSLSPTGEWYALCDRQTRLSLDSEDMVYLRHERSRSSNHAPCVYVRGEDLKSIRLAIVHQLFPDSDIRIYFKSGLRSFQALKKRLTWRKPSKQSRSYKEARRPRGNTPPPHDHDKPTAKY